MIDCAMFVLQVVFVGIYANIICIHKNAVSLDRGTSLTIFNIQVEMYRGGFNQAADNLLGPLEVLLGLGFATLVAPENDMPCIQAWPLGEFHCSVL